MQALEASEVVTKMLHLPPHVECEVTVQARSARSRLEDGWGPSNTTSILTYASGKYFTTSNFPAYAESTRFSHFDNLLHLFVVRSYI